MLTNKGLAHFSIPVSDVEKSARFYTEVVGCTHLSTLPNYKMSFLDANGVCVILVKRDPPINLSADHGGVHHAFLIEPEKFDAALDHLRSKGVEIVLEEDREDGVLNGPRAYFRDPDGTMLEFLNLKYYAGAKAGPG